MRILNDAFSARNRRITSYFIIEIVGLLKKSSVDSFIARETFETICFIVCSNKDDTCQKKKNWGLPNKSRVRSKFARGSIFRDSLFSRENKTSWLRLNEKAPPPSFRFLFLNKETESLAPLTTVFT